MLITNIVTKIFESVTVSNNLMSSTNPFVFYLEVSQLRYEKIFVKVLAAKDI